MHRLLIALLLLAAALALEAAAKLRPCAQLVIVRRAASPPPPGMAAWLRSHPYVVSNKDLDAANFSGTRGCLLIFRDIDVDSVFGDPLLAPLRPHFEELRAAAVAVGGARGSNAFVCNVLMQCGGGTGVGWHVDDTVSSALPDDDEEDRLATAVAVLYILSEAARGGGGELQLRSGRRTSTVRPRSGDVAVFAGGLEHRVLPLQQGSPPRICLVVESYRLNPQELSSEIPIQHQLHGNIAHLESSLVRLDIKRINMIGDVRAARAAYAKIPKWHLKCERAEEQLLVCVELEKELALMESELVRGF